jgi:2'-5' RNA ligase
MMAESVGLFLPLPERLARQYPPEGREGEDSSPVHVTFVYIGDVEDERLDELEGVLRRVLQAVPPLDLKLLPPRTFESDSGQTILHSPVHCPGLKEAHDAIKQALERRGFTVEAYPDFKPHVTIEYVDRGERPKLRYIEPTGRWRADTVGFWAGDNRKDLPLGYRKQVTAATGPSIHDLLSNVMFEGLPPDKRRIAAQRFRRMRERNMDAFIQEKDRDKFVLCELCYRKTKRDRAHVVMTDEDLTVNAPNSRPRHIGPYCWKKLKAELARYEVKDPAVTTAGTTMTVIAGGLAVGDRLLKDANGAKAGAVVSDIKAKGMGNRTAVIIEFQDGSSVTVGRWAAFEVDRRSAWAKRDVIACLLRANRPDLANAVAHRVVAARAIYYHGTSSVFAKRILSEGFVPNPKRKVWDGETGKFESYYGTYASKDFDIAWDAAKTAARKFNGRPTIFEVQVETRGALIDEDELPDMQAALEEALDWSLYGLSEGSFPDGSESAEEFIDGDYIDQLAEQARDIWFPQFFELYNRYDRAAQQQLKKHLRFKVFYLAYSMLRAAAEGSFYNNKPFDDEVREAEREIIKAVGSVGKLTQNVKNVRVTEPITFRGANRIVSAIVRSDVGTESPEVYTVFGKPSPKMLAAAKKVWESKFQVEPKSLSSVPGFQDRYDDRHGSFF